MSHTNRTTHYRQCQGRSIPGTQRGVGMLEVLIALLILSIGLLGIAALQITAFNNNNSAMSRSVATINSYSILDAMRADRTNALAGQYNVTMPSPVTTANCIKTGTTLADEQLNTWRQQIQQNMGSTACGSVSCGLTGCDGNATTNTTCCIKIQFDDTRASGGNIAQTITTEVVL